MQYNYPHSLPNLYSFDNYALDAPYYNMHYAPQAYQPSSGLTGHENPALTVIPSNYATQGNTSLFYGPCQASSTPLRQATPQEIPHSKTSHSRRRRSEAEVAGEKRRTARMNLGFEALRRCLPDIPDGTRVPKGRLLKMAVAYIRNLETILSEDDRRREQSSGSSFYQSSDPSATSLPSTSENNENINGSLETSVHDLTNSHYCI